MNTLNFSGEINLRILMFKIEYWVYKLWVKNLSLWGLWSHGGLLVITSIITRQHPIRMAKMFIEKAAKNKYKKSPKSIQKSYVKIGEKLTKKLWKWIITNN